MSVTARAIWYIESHLTGELSLETIAEASGVSRFHLSRAFSAAGHSLSAYVRGRRLSEAAKQLANGAPAILDVALEAGYGSHEAFTRAFQQQFGLTPESLRARGGVDGLSLTEAIRMNPTSTLALRPPRLTPSPALLIFGLGQRYEAGNNAAIPQQWDRFLPYFGNIEGQVGRVAYGVVFNCDEANNFDYLCGVEVPQFPAHPQEFTRLRIPSQNYAVFEHREHISSIGATWKAIWEHALRDSGYRAADGPFFERYGENFDGRTGLGGVELWIPVLAPATC